jgi:hypothetical protein
MRYRTLKRDLSEISLEEEIIMNATTSRRLFARKRIIVLFSMLILLLAVIYFVIPTADLRNDAIKRSGITEQVAAKGKQLLLTAAQAHGIEKAKSYTTAEFTFADEWTGLMGKFMNPWPENNKSIRMQTLLGTFTCRVEFLEGKGAGEIWGIQAWAAYKQENKNTEAVFEEDGTIQFFLPTQHFFSELPFRVLQTEIIAYMDNRSLEGKDYHLVFATWGTAEPNTDYDQYVIWINKETSLIEKMSYTAREMFSFMEATIHFSDFKNIQGVMVPFKHTTTMDRPEDVNYDMTEEYLHQITFTDFRFDTFDKAELLADKNRQPSAAKKEPRR